VPRHTCDFVARQNRSCDHGTEISVAVRKRGCTNLILIELAAKISRQYYRDVLQMQKLTYTWYQDVFQPDYAPTRHSHDTVESLGCETPHSAIQSRVCRSGNGAGRINITLVSTAMGDRLQMGELFVRNLWAYRSLRVPKQLTLFTARIAQRQPAVFRLHAGRFSGLNRPARATRYIDEGEIWHGELTTVHG